MPHLSLTMTGLPVRSAKNGFGLTGWICSRDARSGVIVRGEVEQTTTYGHGREGSSWNGMERWKEGRGRLLLFNSVPGHTKCSSFAFSSRRRMSDDETVKAGGGATAEDDISLPKSTVHKLVQGSHSSLRKRTRYSSTQSSTNHRATATGLHLRQRRKRLHGRML